MLIRSQSKKSLVDAKGTFLTISKIKTLKDTKYTICIVKGEVNVDLGNYATKERAIEVLDAIGKEIVGRELIKLTLVEGLKGMSGIQKDAMTATITEDYGYQMPQE